MRSGDPASPPSLGVVVPTLNEVEHLPSLLSDLSEMAVPTRVVVADGGSTDATRELARAAGATVILARRGRAHQMNAGARVVRTPWILFLHADSRLPPEARDCVARRLTDACDMRPAFFRFSLDGKGWFWRFIEFGQWLRERITRMAYGDQGLLVRRIDLEDIGGFPPVPIMEDVAIWRALRARGAVQRLPARLPTSPRRFQKEGRWRAWLRNAKVLRMTLAGTAPEELAHLYPVRGAAARGGRMALVFARDPQPGRVKTRLAAEIGASAAAELYATMASDTVDRLRSPAYQLVVCYDPPTAAAEVQAWLGHDVTLMPQAEGDLGHRMWSALRDGLEVAAQACVVGTDVPDLDATLVEQAFDRLSQADVVIGPAIDGGYYLLALERAVPELFEDIPWSTSEVLDRTLAVARDLGLRVSTMKTLRDVDTLADLEPSAGSA